jgi:hypothetical protein
MGLSRGSGGRGEEHPLWGPPPVRARNPNKWSFLPDNEGCAVASDKPAHRGPGSSGVREIAAGHFMYWASTMEYEEISMDDLIAYLGIGTLAFIIGGLSGFLAMTRYYRGRIAVVLVDCEKAESVVPIINELDRES